jgi:hypothetical protein
MDGSRLVKLQLPARLVEAMDWAVDLDEAYPDRSSFVADAVRNLLADLDVGPSAADALPRGLEPPADPESTLAARRLQAAPRYSGGPRPGSGLAQSARWALEPAANRDHADRWDRASAREAVTPWEQWMHQLRTRGPVETSEWPDALDARGMSDADPLAALEAELVLAVPPDGPPPLTEGRIPKPDKPTWGMHNRDWPTLWALADLARRTAELRAPVPFSPWRQALGERASELAARLEALGTRFDVSGFPAARRRGDGSTLRFLALFVGERVGVGPLFSLGLAGPAEPAADAPGRGRSTRDFRAIALTPAGLDLLHSLAGFAPWPAPVPDGRRRAWVSHLRTWVPADFALLVAVMEEISGGHDTRTTLVDAVAIRMGWEPGSNTAKTNVAGMIGRAREWNLVQRRQGKDRYRLVPDALTLVAAGPDPGPSGHSSAARST